MPTLPKTYIYQISRNGAFLGNLPNVTSEFSLAQQINTAFTTIDVTCKQTIDVSHELVQPLQTEEGQPFETEGGEIIYEERRPDAIGNGNASALIRNHNDVAIYEYSDNYPNGKLVFQGFISKIGARVGSGDDVRFTATSDGVDLDNMPIEGADTVDVSQATQDTGLLIYERYTDKGVSWSRGGQTWTAGQTNLSAILLRLAAVDATRPQTVTIYIWTATDNFTTPVASVSRVITSTTPADYMFKLPAALVSVAGQQYSWGAYSDDGGTGAGCYLYYKNTDVYAGGAGYYNAYSSGSGSAGWYTISPAADFYFKTYYSAGATEVPYTSQDPTAIVKAIIDTYVSQGGSTNYAVGSTDLTGDSLDYTFKVNTVLEGIKKMLELAPSDWYWYVDPATRILYFKQTASTATHKLLFGRHIESLDLESTVENVKTRGLFSGGDTGSGDNLFLQINSASALAANNGRVGLAKLADNRVTHPETGEAILQNYLDEHDTEEYQTSTTVSDDTYDTSLISVGDTVGFGNSNTSVDALVLQVVRKVKKPSAATLYLGTLPPQQAAQVAAIERGLRDVQTIDNPSVPS